MCQAPTQVDFDNSLDVIRFIVDNNPTAVRNNFSRYGLNVGGLTPCMMKEKLISMFNSGYDIRGLIKVPFNPSADNYTTAIAGASGMKTSWDDIGNFVESLGTGIGAIFNPPTTIVNAAPPPMNYTPFIMGGVALFAVLILVIFLKK